VDLHGVSFAAGELVALAALLAASTWLGISDWRTRSVGLGAIRASYLVAVAVNALIVVIVTVATDLPAIDVLIELMLSAAPAAIMIMILSSVVITFWKLGLLASGDAYVIPALLSMLLFAATPAVVAAYFIAAIASTSAVFVARNVYNNARYRDKMYGPLLHRLYLMLFCYYGSGSDIRYAFAYERRQQQDGEYPGMKIRRDYDEEPFYQGKEKTWLVPGLPVLSGFAPATAVAMSMAPISIPIADTVKIISIL